MKGTLVERAPGVWRLRVYVGTKPNGSPDQRSRTWKNLDDKGRVQPGGRRKAESELSRFVTEMEQGRRPSAGTLGDLLDRWLEHITPNRSPSTVAEYRRKIDRDIKPAIGRERLTKLSGYTLDRFYAERSAAGASPTTVHHLHSIIHAALNRGRKWGLVRDNAADDADPPPMRTGTARPATLADVRALMERLVDSNPPMALIVLLAAVTGARRSELCRLRWSDVDFDRMTLRVRGTKNESSHRIVALDEPTSLALKVHRAWQETLAGKALTALDDDPYLASPDPDGGRPYKPDSVTQAMRRASDGKVHPHALRHFTATQLVASGMDPRTIAGRLGHADANTTLRVYAHFLEERDRAAAQLLGELLQLPAAAGSR